MKIIKNTTMRVRTPRNNEIMGIVESMLGSSRIMVKCEDKKIRLCRIIGKMRKRVWLRLGDAVIVKPWEIQGDKRGDVVWKYTFTQANILRKKGLLTI